MATMPEMTSKPQVIQRTVKRSFNHSIGEWMPEQTYRYQTSWWEAEQDGVKALAQTKEKAEEFVRFILDRSARKTAHA
jgi:hypothetical protein